MVTWIRPCGTPIEMADDFNADNLKRIGWKKKKKAKKVEPPKEQTQNELLGE